ncbi:MAG: NADH-quinone oxidoreductase subunit M [Candidatus Omnitrophica bacterium]|nr:NADH-quinone oxidoreductase subunit M [Candidatus Omnitrophota bacterium]
MTHIFGTPILTLLCFLPLIGTLAIVIFTRKDEEKKIKNIALWFSVAAFLISLLILPRFRTDTAEMQFVERAEWIPAIGAEYLLGIDGISILLILLTTLLTVIAVLSSSTAITDRLKEYYGSLLLLETGMLGVFMALDFVLFYVFWEVMLVPMYFLIGIWGGPNRLYAAIKFFLYTLFGSVLMLLGILALYFLNADPAFGSGEHTFNMITLFNVQLPFHFQCWIFAAFFIGFAIKVPVFPFHTWLPDAHVEAPTAGSVILAGVLLKMGTYGFIRVCLPMLPQASEFFAPFVAVLAMIGIVYGALVAMAQTDIKKLVAYSSVSHLGFVMLGLFAMNSQGITGGVLQMINHGISTGALFLLVGIIYERRHTRKIQEFGGLAHVMPVYAALFAVTLFSSIGLPGLNGFVGEFLILLGAFQKELWYAAVAVSGIVLGAGYMLWLYQRVMFGTVTHPENKMLKDCSRREVLYMAPLIILMLWIGIYPKPYLRLIESSVMGTIQSLKRPSAGPDLMAMASQTPPETAALI